MNADRPTLPRLRRRELLLLGTGAFVVAALPLAARRRPRLVRRTLPVMGTIAELVAVHDDPDAARRALDAAFTELQRVETLMSRFLPWSEVGRANALAARGPVALGPETARVVAAALQWAEWSGGAFDPCLARASDLWDVLHREEPPPADVVAALADLSLWRAVDLSPATAGARLRFADPRAALDLGGIAKGHAVDLAADALRAHGVRDGFACVGGDLYALGRSEDGDPWRVGVRDPADPARLCATLRVADEAVATSGDYLRFFRHGGQNYHHLLDPATATPVAGPRHSLTVRAATCRTADAAATTLFGMDLATAVSLLAQHAPDAAIAA